MPQTEEQDAKWRSENEAHPQRGTDEAHSFPAIFGRCDIRDIGKRHPDVCGTQSPDQATEKDVLIRVGVGVDQVTNQREGAAPAQDRAAPLSVAEPTHDRSDEKLGKRIEGDGEPDEQAKLSIRAVRGNVQCRGGKVFES